MIARFHDRKTKNMGFFLKFIALYGGSLFLSTHSSLLDQGVVEFLVGTELALTHLVHDYHRLLKKSMQESGRGSG